MRKLILTKGLPASGKTTWAKQYQKENPNTILVNKDDLRAMLHQSVHSKGREEFVLSVRDFIVEKALKEGHDVIVHDTNFAGKHSLRLGSIAQMCKAELEVQDFTHVSVEECIKRDAGRVGAVGASVIKKMYKDYLKPVPPVIEHDDSLPDAIVCDLDGTLALFPGQNPYERDFTKDILNQKVYAVISAFEAACGDGWGDVRLLLVSGRKDKFRDQTEQWLAANYIHYDALWMRETQPDGVQEPKDVLVKEKIYNEHIKGKYNVLFVLDDRDQVVEFWRAQGLTCMQVAEGDF